KILSENSASSFKWTSSDPSVVRVYSTGKIVAQKAGTSVITVTTYNGKTASCEVTVA
ncbi:MAG: Ig-like domain-containing protein, partial [Clostridia bacterium]|nr:Ig-like domain-containing protein [Clostridia bacterium]